MKFFNLLKPIRNQFGATFTEILVAAGLMGAVSLGVVNLSSTSQKQTIGSNQNFDFDNYARELKSYLNDKATCDGLISESDGEWSINMPAMTTELRFNSQLIEAKLIPAPNNGAVGVIPVTIYLAFQKGESRSHGMAIRRVLFNAQVAADGSFQGCANYLSEAQKTAYRLSCELLGGSLEDDLGSDPPYRCNLAGINNNTPLVKNLMRKFCIEKINPTTGDAYVDPYCQDINLGAGKLIEGSNIKSNSITINGSQTRTTYDQDDCSGKNRFIRRIRETGEVQCVTLSFCVPVAGQNSACGAAVVPPPARVDGVCGVADNACTAGQYFNVDDDANVKWECRGLNGGDTDACTGSVVAGPKVDGVCSSTDNECNFGKFSEVDDDTNVKWQCVGLNGGDVDDCTGSAIAAPEVATCGTAISSSYKTAPTTNLCGADSSVSIAVAGTDCSDPTQDTMFGWQCTHDRSGDTILCEAGKECDDVTGGGGDDPPSGTAGGQCPGTSIDWYFVQGKCISEHTACTELEEDTGWKDMGGNIALCTPSSDPACNHYWCPAIKKGGGDKDLVHGKCGTAIGYGTTPATSLAVADQLCASGNVADLSPAGVGRYSWKCEGTGGGNTVQCGRTDKCPPVGRVCSAIISGVKYFQGTMQTAKNCTAGGASCEKDTCEEIDNFCYMYCSVPRNEMSKGVQQCP